MKKSMVIILVMILIIPFIFAVEVDIKTEYNQGETMIAKISGNFLEPVSRENIFFYRGHVRIPLEYDIAKINDEYYLYAQLDKPEENYTLSIENTQYMVGKDVSNEDIKKNFHITENTADFSVKPGFIITNKDFSVNVQNLQDKKITIEIKDNYNTSELDIKSGEIKELNFEIQNNSSTEFNLLELSSDNLKYEIPTLVFSSNEPEANNTLIDNTTFDDDFNISIEINFTTETGENNYTSFRLEPSKLNFSMPTNSNTTRILYLHNTGETTLENISFFISSSLENFVNFSIDDFEEIMPNKSVRIILDFNSSVNEETIEGKLTAKIKGIYAYAGIIINVLSDYVPSKEEKVAGDINVVSETCLEKKGSICNQDEECSGETVSAKDDICCLGSCIKPKKSSTGKIIGWSLIILIIVFLIWFFKSKYRKAKKDVNLVDIAKKGKKKYF